jgi:hypothetical protein
LIGKEKNITSLIHILGGIPKDLLDIN